MAAILAASISLTSAEKRQYAEARTARLLLTDMADFWRLNRNLSELASHPAGGSAPELSARIEHSVRQLTSRAELQVQGKELGHNLRELRNDWAAFRNERSMPALAAASAASDGLARAVEKLLDTALTGQAAADAANAQLIAPGTYVALGFGAVAVVLIVLRSAQRARERARIALLEAAAQETAETDRQRMQRALRSAEARFRTVYDVAEIGIALYDVTRTVIDQNPALQKIFGVEARAVLDEQRENIRDFFEHPDIEPQVRELQIIRSAQKRWVSLTLSPVYEENVCILVILMAQDVTERKALEQKLRHEADHDVLTKLANRAAFQREISASASAARERPFACLFVDLDHFKEANDRHGHAAGDTVLRIVADRLRSVVSRNDLIARLGGDEFALLLRPCSDRDVAEAVAERIQAAVSAPIVIDGNNVLVSASIGIAFGKGAHCVADEVVQHADTAMYASKQAGRARHTVFGDAEAARARGPVVFSPIDSDAINAA
jgi:diguanylate cyclase (GGDEF)-like protein/PAS domain S-box-containing protein